MGSVKAPSAENRCFKVWLKTNTVGTKRICCSPFGNKY